VIRAVVDTNVLVSGLLSPAGNEALILLAIHQGLIHPCFSERMMEEYAEVLARRKFGFAAEKIAAAVGMFRERGELVVPAGKVPALPDANDVAFLHCALTARAEFLVTGNRRHFPPGVRERQWSMQANCLTELHWRSEVCHDSSLCARPR
jgi:putative PIN family toxin of toxin-antitoxin system